MNLSHAAAIDHFIPQRIELKTVAVIRMENQKQSSKAVADEQWITLVLLLVLSLFLLLLGVSYFQARLIQSQLAANIAQDDKIVIS